MSLAVVNQEVGDMMTPFLIEAAQRFGHVDLYCGNARPDLPNVNQHIGPSFSNQSSVSRVRSWLAFSRWLKASAASVPKGTPLLLTSNPPTWPLIATAWRKNVNGPVTALLWDTYPEAIERFAGVKPTSPISKGWRRMNNRGLAAADTILTISQDMEELWLQYNPQRDRPCLKVVDLWVDTDAFQPRVGDGIRGELGWEDKFVVVYSGNIGAVHDVSILPAAARLLQNRSDIHIVIMGGGARFESLKTEASNLKNVEFLPPQSFDRFPQVLAAADATIVSLGKGAEGVSMPSKAFSNMAAGTALITLNRAGGDLDRLVQQCECGINVAEHDPKLLTAAITSLADNPAQTARYRAAARKAAVERFDARIVIPNLLDLIATKPQ